VTVHEEESTSKKQEIQRMAGKFQKMDEMSQELEDKSSHMKNKNQDKIRQVKFVKK